MELNRNHLKIIAVLSMLVDHIGAIFFPKIIFLRIVGRISFPIFAYFVAEGWHYTHNKARYAILLFVFALLSFVPYLLAVAFLAQVVSHFVRTRESSMMVILFSSLVLLFISGISWPWCSVPTFWKIVAYLFPSTPGINGFVRMTNEGARLSQVSFEYAALWIQALCYMLLAMVVMKRDIRQSCRNFNRQHRRPKPTQAKNKG